MEEIASSLETIIKQGRIIKNEFNKKAHQIKIKQTSNLSASKSKRAPKEVSVFVFLAILRAIKLYKENEIEGINK